MARALAIHEGIIRPALIKELEEFRAAGQRVTSYYIDLDGQVGTNTEAMRLLAKDALKEFREQREQLDVPHAQQQALRDDWELVQELAGTIVGARGTRSLACFVGSQADFSRVLRLPLPVRNRAFFEERFVLWPLYQVLDQADHYAIALTDKEKARLFLYYLEQIEEITDIIEEIPGKVRYPDPVTVWHYMNKHVEKFHHHFENVAQALLRQFEQAPFEHVIIGARTETLPWFESHLHRYLRDRVIARWEADVKAPMPQIHERAIQEEEQFLQRQAQDIWQTIQDYRLQRGAVGPDEVFPSLWQRRVQALLVTPQVVRAGFRCSACSRLQLRNGPCVECGGKLTEVADVYEEAVHDAIEQDAHARYWKDPTLKAVDSIAALKRF